MTPDHIPWTLADLRAALAPEETPACLRDYTPPQDHETALPQLLDLEPCRHCGTLREVYTDPAPGYVCVQACDECGDGMRLEMEGGTP
jgi:hypothetical protein